MKPCSACGIPIHNQQRVCDKCDSKNSQQEAVSEVQEFSNSTAPLKAKVLDCGALPTYGVSRVDSRIFFRLSRFFYLMGLVSFLIGISLLARNYNSPFIYAFGLFLALGGIAIPLIGLFITKNRFWGMRFEIDLAKQSVKISRLNESICFGLDEIVGFQVLEYSGGCQLNLVTLNKHGETERTFVYAHSYTYYVHRIAKRITYLSSIQILNNTFEHSVDGG